MKTCKWCKKPFKPNPKHKKYCCVECSNNGTEKNQRKYRIKNKEKIRIKKKLGRYPTQGQIKKNVR